MEFHYRPGHTKRQAAKKALYIYVFVLSCSIVVALSPVADLIPAVFLWIVIVIICVFTLYQLKMVKEFSLLSDAENNWASSMLCLDHHGISFPGVGATNVFFYSEITNLDVTKRAGSITDIRVRAGASRLSSTLKLRDYERMDEIYSELRRRVFGDE